ncbi:hypothetical protein NUM3379_08450 [Kineococcus sp. NUM-3379]
MARPTTRWSALAAAAVVLATGAVTAPAQAASSPWIAWNGATIQHARVPAVTVDLTVNSPGAFERLSLSVAGVERGSTTAVTRLADGWSATVRADLAGLSGEVPVVASLTAGKRTSTVRKTLRVVQPSAADKGSIRTDSAKGGARTTRSRDDVARAFPGPATTGVRPDARLTPSGDLTVTRAGAVVENLDVRGCVKIDAPDVTIRNTRIACTKKGQALAVQLTDKARNVVIEDSEIDGGGGAVVAIGWGGYTLRRVNVHDTVDGPRLGNDVLIEDSWIHDMVRRDNYHSDASQSTSGQNIVVRRNHLDPSGGRGDFLNAAVQLGSETGQKLLRNALFEGNFFNGGTFSVNVRCDINAENVVFRNNTFGDKSKFGSVLAPVSKIRFEGNTVGWTGRPADVKNC